MISVVMRCLSMTFISIYSITYLSQTEKFIRMYLYMSIFTMGKKKKKKAVFFLKSLSNETIFWLYFFNNYFVTSSVKKRGVIDRLYCFISFSLFCI